MGRGGPSSHGPRACGLTASARLSLASQGERPCRELFEAEKPALVDPSVGARCVCVCVRWAGCLRPAEDPTESCCVEVSGVKAESWTGKARAEALGQESMSCC